MVRQNRRDSGISLSYQHFLWDFIWDFVLGSTGFVINEKSNIYYLNDVDVYQLHHYHTI